MGHFDKSIRLQRLVRHIKPFLIHLKSKRLSKLHFTKGENNYNERDVCN